MCLVRIRVLPALSCLRCWHHQYRKTKKNMPVQLSTTWTRCSRAASTPEHTGTNGASLDKDSGEPTATLNSALYLCRNETRGRGCRRPRRRRESRPESPAARPSPGVPEHAERRGRGGQGQHAVVSLNGGGVFEEVPPHRPECQNLSGEISRGGGCVEGGRTLERG